MKKPLLLVIRDWVCVSFAQPCMAADPWPANPLKRVVIFPAGGSTVVVARLTRGRVSSKSPAQKLNKMKKLNRIYPGSTS